MAQKVQLRDWSTQITQRYEAAMRKAEGDKKPSNVREAAIATGAMVQTAQDFLKTLEAFKKEMTHKNESIFKKFINIFRSPSAKKTAQFVKKHNMLGLEFSKEFEKTIQADLDKLRKIRTDIYGRMAQLPIAQKNLDLRKSQVETLEKLIELKGARDEMKSGIRTIETAIGKAEAQYRNTQEKLASLNDSIDKTNGALRGQLHALEANQVEIARLRAEKPVDNKKIADTEQRASAARHAVANARTLLSRLGDQVERNKEILKKEKHDLKELYKQYEGEVKDYKGMKKKVEKLETRANELKVAPNDLPKLKIHLKQLEDHIVKLDTVK